MINCSCVHWSCGPTHPADVLVAMDRLDCYAHAGCSRCGGTGSVKPDAPKIPQNIAELYSLPCNPRNESVNDFAASMDHNIKRAAMFGSAGMHWYPGEWGDACRDYCDRKATEMIVQKNGANTVSLQAKIPQTIDELFAMPGHLWGSLLELREYMERDILMGGITYEHLSRTPWVIAYEAFVEREISERSSRTARETIHATKNITLPSASSTKAGGYTITNTGDQPITVTFPVSDAMDALRAQITALTEERDELRAMLNRVHLDRAARAEPILLADWPDDE